MSHDLGVQLCPQTAPQTPEAPPTSGAFRMGGAMPDGTTAPRSAAEAAHQLARQGRHVHLVSEGQGVCLKGTCDLLPVLPPAPSR